jgi:hypothetical protein
VPLAILGRSVRCVAVLAGLVATAVLGFAGEADAAWVAPFAISSLGTQASEPQIAADAQGNVTVAASRPLSIATTPGLRSTPPGR